MDTRQPAQSSGKDNELRLSGASMSYTKDALVQQTTAEYLERQLGCESGYAYIHNPRHVMDAPGRDFKL